MSRPPTPKLVRSRTLRGTEPTSSTTTGRSASESPATLPYDASFTTVSSQESTSSIDIPALAKKIQSIRTIIYAGLIGENTLGNWAELQTWLHEGDNPHRATVEAFHKSFTERLESTSDIALINSQDINPEKDAKTTFIDLFIPQKKGLLQRTPTGLTSSVESIISDIPCFINFTGLIIFLNERLDIAEFLNDNLDDLLEVNAAYRAYIRKRTLPAIQQKENDKAASLADQKNKKERRLFGIIIKNPQLPALMEFWRDYRDEKITLKQLETEIRERTVPTTEPHKQVPIRKGRRYTTNHDIPDAPTTTSTAPANKKRSQPDPDEGRDRKRVKAEAPAQLARTQSAIFAVNPLLENTETDGQASLPTFGNSGDGS